MTEWEADLLPLFALYICCKIIFSFFLFSWKAFFNGTKNVEGGQIIDAKLIAKKVIDSMLKSNEGKLCVNWIWRSFRTMLIDRFSCSFQKRGLVLNRLIGSSGAYQKLKKIDWVSWCVSPQCLLMDSHGFSLQQHLRMRWLLSFSSQRSLGGMGKT